MHVYFFVNLDEDTYNEKGGVFSWYHQLSRMVTWFQHTAPIFLFKSLPTGRSWTNIHLMRQVCTDICGKEFLYI